MKTKQVLAGLGCMVLGISSLHAHFQTLIPSEDSVTAESARAVKLDIRFTHPMENGPVMEMGTPTRFGVVVAGETHDLLQALRKQTINGKSAYTAEFSFRQAGDHVFFIEPSPYWELGERKLIIHYTKVVVDAFGSQEGWDAAVGLPVEIEPLTRPYGLWTGNTFRGIVRRHGKPVPRATIEVEYLNADGRIKPPSEAFVTQVIKADENGVFAYTMPRAGWWGFAALIDGDRKMENAAGEQVDVELGGLIWVKTVDMK